MNRIITTTGFIALLAGVSGCHPERAVVAPPLDPKSEPRGTTIPVTRVSLAIGDSVRLIPVDKIANARGVLWISSLDAVVRVSPTGWAFGMARGTAGVSATAKLTTQRWVVDVR